MDGRTDGYAAVLTIESLKASQMNIHVVPSHWMKDNVLYYPPDSMGKTTIEGIIKAGRFAAVTDMKKWKKFAYIVKKRFLNFDAADNYVNERQQTDDTDGNDDENLAQLKLAQSHLNRDRKTKGKQQFTLSSYFVKQFLNAINIFFSLQ